MAQSVFTDIGPMPDLKKWALIQFRAKLVKHRLGLLGDAAKARTTTYYVDSAAGSDSNDGLTTGAPFATLGKVHDVLVASSGDVRFRFKNGSTWTGKGKDFVWMAGDGGHNAAVYCNKTGVTFDTYGDGLTVPPKFRISAGLGAIWTANTNSYYADVSAFDRIDMIYETDGTTTPFSRQTSLANCEANERSFFYDSATDRLYVHYDGAAEPPSDLYAIEQNDVSCFRLEGDDNILDMNGANFFGFGYDLDDTNSHDYAVATGVSGTKMITVANVAAYYGSAHLVANWWAGATNEEGGFANFINIRGAYGSTLLDRVINCYQPSGGGEFFCFNCQSDGYLINSVNGHTGGTNHTFCWADSCGGRGAIFGNATEDQAVNYGGIFGSPENRIESANLGNAIINCCYFLFNPATGPVNTPSTQQLYNTILDYKHTGTANSFIGTGIYDSSVASASITADYKHCMFRIGNNIGGSRRGAGLSYNALQNNDQPTGATANRCVWIGYDSNASYPSVPGIGDADARQIDCTYYQMVRSASRNQAGWINVTTGVELDSDPVRIDGDKYTYIPNTDSDKAKAPLLDYDIFGSRRSGSSSTDGPIERTLNLSTGSGVGGGRVLTRGLSNVVGRSIGARL